jgi:hypothetical protein
MRKIIITIAILFILSLVGCSNSKPVPDIETYPYEVWYGGMYSYAKDYKIEQGRVILYGFNGNDIFVVPIDMGVGINKRTPIEGKE